MLNSHQQTVRSTLWHSPSGLTVREMPLTEVDTSFSERWAELESNSLNGNAFLSPGFVLAVARNVVERPPFLVAIEDKSTGSLTGLGVFEEVHGSRLLPLTHLKHWETDFGFTGGVLLEANEPDASAAALFEWLKVNGSRWHGLAFSNLPAESPTARTLFTAAGTAGHTWRQDSGSRRALIRTEEIPDDVMTLYSKNRRKSLRQNLRKLEAHGSVKFQIHRRDPDGCRRQEFLRLEASGWKGEDGTALGSAPQLTAFCREWMDSLLESGMLAICELSVDDQPVAMSLNPISGETLFAFKIGWDASFAACSPGTLCEWHMIRSLKSELPRVRFVDSCSTEGSYVEKIWPWKLKLTDGVFPTTWFGGLAVDSMLRVKYVKRLLRGKLE